VTFAAKVSSWSDGGATNIGHFVDLFGPDGSASGSPACATRAKSAISAAAWDRVGPYFVCVADLEDELIPRPRHLRVEELIGQRARSARS